MSEPYTAYCDKCSKPAATGESDGTLLCEEHAEETGGEGE